MSKALFIIDVQNDFTEGGALGVAGGNDVASGITEYLDENAGEYDYIIASRDWHDADNDNGGHFSDEPDFIDTWPEHCVADTHGAEYHPSLDVSHISHHVLKGQGEPAYSIFEGRDVASGRTFLELVNDLGVDEVDVVGIATDHCVLASSMDALDEGIEVTVLVDLTAGVGKESSRAALEEIQESGGELEYIFETPDDDSDDDDYLDDDDSYDDDDEYEDDDDYDDFDEVDDGSDDDDDIDLDDFGDDDRGSRRR